MADDTKYRDIISVTLVDGNRSQLFSIDRDFQLWTMYMTYPLPIANWTEWAKFPLPGKSGGVIKIAGTPGKTFLQPGVGNQYWYPRIWAVDTDNDLWSCEGILNTGGKLWSDWSPWVAPYPNN